jgi:hypothetical protein
VENLVPCLGRQSKSFENIKIECDPSLNRNHESTYINPRAGGGSKKILDRRIWKAT